MKKRSRAPKRSNGLRPEYDFSGGVRGKYAARYRLGTNVIVLDPDVAKEFKDSNAVNRALRSLLKSPSRDKRPSSAKPS